MNANENTFNLVQSDEVVVLGVVSVDTHGIGVAGEGDGLPMLPGISEE